MVGPIDILPGAPDLRLSRPSSSARQESEPRRLRVCLDPPPNENFSDKHRMLGPDRPRAKVTLAPPATRFWEEGAGQPLWRLHSSAQVLGVDAPQSAINPRPAAPRLQRFSRLTV